MVGERANTRRFGLALDLARRLLNALLFLLELLGTATVFLVEARLFLPTLTPLLGASTFGGLFLCSGLLFLGPLPLLLAFGGLLFLPLPAATALLLATVLCLLGGGSLFFFHSNDSSTLPCSSICVFEQREGAA